MRLASNSIDHLAEMLKTKIDDLKNRIDVDLRRLKEITETITKEELTVFVYLPQKYLGDTELSANCQKLELIDLCSENFELDGKVSEVFINGCTGEIELYSSLDMDVTVVEHRGDIAINQVTASSKIYLPASYSFEAIKKGMGTKISFEENGKKTADFSLPDAENHIESNGIKSELTIIKE